MKELSAIVSVRIPEEILQFEGQTKGKLGTSEARTVTDAIVSQKLLYFLEENADLSANLVRKAIRAQQAREAARKAREDARSGKKTKKSDTLLSGKLSPAQSRNAAKNELYLVEGDSAEVLQNKVVTVCSKLFCRFVVKSSILKKQNLKTS